MKKFTLLILSSCLIISLYSQYDYLFQNPELDTEVRIDNLLSLMTLEEKISALSTDPSVPRLNVKGTRHVEGLHGLAMGGPSNWGRKNPSPTTIFPQAIGLAETWDKELVRKVAFIEGYEVRYMFQNENYLKGGLIVRAPNADIGRDPRWGRTEECYGEDAWFNGQMVISFIKGLQGDHEKYWLTASLMKHFLANSNEDGRDSSSSDFNERLFREYYSYPFYKGITDGGSRAYMTAYNANNGVPCTIHPVLKEVTVKEWGQNGIICTDGGAYSLLTKAFHYFPDKSKAAEACIKAGINQFLDNYKDGVTEALEKGYIQEADIDSALRGSYRIMIKLGQLDPDTLVSFKKIGRDGEIEPWNTEEHKQMALEATRKSIVLLKNSANTLPLDKSKYKNIAVIGRDADSVLLDWYSGTPPYTVSPLEGIRRKVGKGVQVNFVRDNKYNRAVELAKQSDIAIVVVGNHPTGDDGWAKCPVPSDGKEAVDRKVILLEQEQLIKSVFEANPNTIIVLISSFPYTINWTNEHIPAILHMTHCSQESGTALADVIFGDYNPAGRLVQTWPQSISQLPHMMDYDITHGRTYLYFEGEALYEFGYGLSYTDFKYSNLKLSNDTLKSDEDLIIQMNIKNSGKVFGEEVPQLYVKHINSDVIRPLKELRGFERIPLLPGETKTISFQLNSRDLAYWNSENYSFVVEEGIIQIMIGSSSKNIYLQENIIVEPN